MSGARSLPLGTRSFDSVTQPEFLHCKSTRCALGFSHGFPAVVSNCWRTRAGVTSLGWQVKRRLLPSHFSRRETEALKDVVTYPGSRREAVAQRRAPRSLCCRLCSWQSVPCCVQGRGRVVTWLAAPAPQQVSGCNFPLSVTAVAAGAGVPRRKGAAEAACGEPFLAELGAQLVTRLLSPQHLSSSRTALALDAPLGQEDIIPFLQKGRAATAAQKD